MASENRGRPRLNAAAPARSSCISPSRLLRTFSVPQLYRMTIFATALARAWNSMRETEWGAYSQTVRPVTTASATAIRWPMGGSTFLPISSRDEERLRPRLVLSRTEERRVGEEGKSREGAEDIQKQ